LVKNNFPLINTLHHVESLEVFFHGPKEVRAAFSRDNTVTVAKDVVNDCHHSIFTRKVGCAIKLCEEQENGMVLLVSCGVPCPRAEGWEGV
jgi:hypothetical protein